MTLYLTEGHSEDVIKTVHARNVKSNVLNGEMREARGSGLLFIDEE